MAAFRNPGVRPRQTADRTIAVTELALMQSSRYDRSRTFHELFNIQKFLHPDFERWQSIREHAEVETW